MNRTITATLCTLVGFGSLASLGCAKQQPALTQPASTQPAAPETEAVAPQPEAQAAEVAMTSAPEFVSAASVLEDETAVGHLERGHTAYYRKDYATAISEFKAAYAIEPNPLLLYAWAQAERFGGNCAGARELYRRFLDTDPAQTQRAFAEANQDRCEG